MFFECQIGKGVHKEIVKSKFGQEVAEVLRYEMFLGIKKIDKLSEMTLMNREKES